VRNAAAAVRVSRGSVGWPGIAVEDI